ncbi:hypothetical protein KSP35_15060 [Aquihabitans sp. G128]|uniref:HD domain-containing protein n=1 Tax=Aquihabitans sp. G128 TaxID=2849779 RepID=UPI001C211419|nr:hypothetical protein [Aquihabitans sp. G128]QXC59695.1 hypothetical protein KSP35_15060 [Aquihabitans sp. G128]
MESLLVHLGASPGAARSVADELAARHREPQRRYHSLEHVTEVLAEVARLLPLEPEADPVAVELAAWFHDAIYDPTAGPGESEEASAHLAHDRLPALWEADRDRLADEVDRLVRLTVGHAVEPHDRSGAVLVDADLWILSSPPERYDRYAADVRAEYAHVGDEAWIAGRGSILTRFLVTASDLYAAGPTDDRDARRERATANLRRELASLRPTAGA